MGVEDIYERWIKSPGVIIPDWGLTLHPIGKDENGEIIFGIGNEDMDQKDLHYQDGEDRIRRAPISIEDMKELERRYKEFPEGDEKEQLEKLIKEKEDGTGKYSTEG